ncbi:MAG: diphthine synthase [Candidatus Micrarchaeota archaeon]|nr:diphthine synthase [Candidatus Micrarchaeota archaeon]
MEKSSKPGPLYLAGLGLCDEEDVPPRSLEVLRQCAHIYAESYTNLMREGTMERLEKKIGKPIARLSREDVEGEKTILHSCSDGPTALLAPGDPMTATTHESLRQAARLRGIEVRILHASSIFSAAAGAAGLQIYKFGKTATIPYWREKFEPVSFIDLLSENRARGAHTLCLLDIDAHWGPMKPSVALELLQKAQERKLKDQTLSSPLLTPATPLFVLWHVGWPDQKIWAGALKDWPYGKEEAITRASAEGSASVAGHAGAASGSSAPAHHEPAGPAVIILPGMMHFSEEESFRQAAAGPGF